jgi:peptidoglycan hydrolase-like protein with peptidoglycan-binding domain
MLSRHWNIKADGRIMRTTVFGVLALSLLVAGCGSNTSQRAATGGLTGAGAGALVGGPIGAVAGAAIGAAGGSAMPEGADTMARQALNQERSSGRAALNDAGLGPTSGSSASSTRRASAGVVKDAQRKLAQDGYYHGKIDGIAGPQTRRAVAAYQQREGLQQTATLDRATLDRLGMQGEASSGASTPPPALSPSQLRRRLSQAGYGNVSDLRRVSDSEWSAHAERNGQQVALRIDANTGRVTHEQTIAGARPPEAGSSTAPGSAAPNPKVGAATPDAGGATPANSGH